MDMVFLLQEEIEKNLEIERAKESILVDPKGLHSKTLLITALSSKSEYLYDVNKNVPHRDVLINWIEEVLENIDNYSILWYVNAVYSKVAKRKKFTTIEFFE